MPSGSMVTRLTQGAPEFRVLLRAALDVVWSRDAAASTDDAERLATNVIPIDRFNPARRMWRRLRL